MPEGIDNIMLKQIAEIEKRDEFQIVAELSGELLKEMIYTVQVYDRREKRTVEKARLSWAGVKEVARSRGNITLSEPVVTDLDGAIRIMVRSTDLTRNMTVFGGCQQPRKMKVTDVDQRTGEVAGHHFEEDPFCFQKALSKAQRNALTLCIPADYAAKCITRFLKAAGKGKMITEGPKGSKPPAKSQIKPLEEWEKVTQAMVPDYPHLERIIWDLCKMQPAELYKELGGSPGALFPIPAWEAFQTIKELYYPRVEEEQNETGDKGVMPG